MVREAQIPIPCVLQSGRPSGRIARCRDVSLREPGKPMRTDCSTGTCLHCPGPAPRIVTAVLSDIELCVCANSLALGSIRPTLLNGSLNGTLSLLQLGPSSCIWRAAKPSATIHLEFYRERDCRSFNTQQDIDYHPVLERLIRNVWRFYTVLGPLRARNVITAIAVTPDCIVPWTANNTENCDTGIGRNGDISFTPKL